MSQVENGTAAAPAPSEETVRKIYVKDLKDRQTIHTVFRATKKNRVTARNGKLFLAVGLADKTGEVDGRIFEQVDAADTTFDVGDYLLIRGEVITYRAKLQVVIHALERLDPEPIDAAEFTPPPPPVVEAPGSRAVGQIRELVERVQDPHVKAILVAFLDDPEIAKGLPSAPAAKGIHHAYPGGLADHILSVMRLAQRMADHYPVADRDLLTAGALLHDIGKVTELSYGNGAGTDYTDEGRLVGHLVMTAQAIREKAARIDGFPKPLELHLTHLVLAHHGQLEYGSPKLPMTIEAQIVHAIDSLDSKIASWVELMAKDSNPRWTAPNRICDRHLWKGASPTTHGKSPVGPRKKDRKKAAAERTKPGHAAPRPAEKPAESLHFEPLESLVSGASPGEPASAPPDAEAPPVESAPTPAETAPVESAPAESIPVSPPPTETESPETPS